MSGGNLEGDVRPLMAAAALTSVFWDDSSWVASSSSEHIAKMFYKNLNKSSAPPPSPLQMVIAKSVGDACGYC